MRHTRDVGQVQGEAGQTVVLAPKLLVSKARDNSIGGFGGQPRPDFVAAILRRDRARFEWTPGIADDPCRYFSMQRPPDA